MKISRWKEYLPKSNEKCMPFLHCMSSCEVILLIKICKIQLPDPLFLVIFISYYISRYHFSQIFRTSFNINQKKIFFTNFPIFMDSLEPPHALNDQNLLSMMEVFQWCSLTMMVKSVKNMTRIIRLGSTATHTMLPIYITVPLTLGWGDTGFSHACGFQWPPEFWDNFQLNWVFYFDLWYIWVSLTIPL